MARVEYKVPKGATVDAWAGGLPEPLKSAVAEIRRTIRKAAPKAREIVKWSWPCYEMIGVVAILFVGRDHVNVELYRGPSLPPAPVPLEGTGKTMRHVKIYTAADVGKIPLAALVKDAVRLDAADNG